MGRCTDPAARSRRHRQRLGKASFPLDSSCAASAFAIWAKGRESAQDSSCHCSDKSEQQRRREVRPSRPAQSAFVPRAYCELAPTHRLHSAIGARPSSRDLHAAQGETATFRKLFPSGEVVRIAALGEIRRQARAQDRQAAAGQNRLTNGSGSSRARGAGGRRSSVQATTLALERAALPDHGPPTSAWPTPHVPARWAKGSALHTAVEQNLDRRRAREGERPDDGRATERACTQHFRPLRFEAASFSQVLSLSRARPM